MEYSPSEADSCSVGHESPCHLWTLAVHYPTYKSTPSKKNLILKQF